MDLSKNEIALVLNLIDVAWAAGAIKAREAASEVEQLREKLMGESKKLKVVND